MNHVIARLVALITPVIDQIIAATENILSYRLPDFRFGNGFHGSLIHATFHWKLGHYQMAGCSHLKAIVPLECAQELLLVRATSHATNQDPIASFVFKMQMAAQGFYENPIQLL